MKKRIIKAIVLPIIFVLAVMGFSAHMNQGDTDMTADMSGASLPTLSFERDGMELNPLVGHKSEMNVASVRDNVLPYDKGTITGFIQMYDAVIASAKYDIYTLNGADLLESGTMEIVEDEFTISVEDLLDTGKEMLLKITFEMENEEQLYFYTRIVKEGDFYVKENMNYIMELHRAIISKTETAALKRGLESNSEGDNSTLQHVNIHSDMKQVLWGNLTPEVDGDVTVEIKEVNASYLSAQLSYRVVSQGDNNEKETYNVKEFFKVCCKDDKFYLLAYDRRTTEVFDVNNVVLSSKGIILGMTPDNIPYKVNKDATVAAFVLERQLWAYNKTEDEFSLVFSFATAANSDARNYHDQHNVRILSMEDNGSMTFSVYGYMNRGEHEGESGLAIYYFDMNTNSIEEKAFIKSNKSYLAIDEELNRLAYYNSKQDILYILVEEDLYKINLTDNTQEVLMENLQKDQYVTSEEGHMIAYKMGESRNQITICNFASDKQLNVQVDEGLEAIPLGFVGEDFVYGYANPENVGYDSSGIQVLGIHKLEIRNTKNQVIKTYEIEGIYILEADVKDNMIALTRAKKNGSSYVGVSEDYITNNEEASGLVELKSYWTDMKQTQYRLVFDESITDTNAKKLDPKYTLYETLLTFDNTDAGEETYFYTYGYGEQAGRFANAADAVEFADQISGVVITPEQNYAWEDGNRVAWYRNFNISRFKAESGETTLEACVRRVLRYEGVENVDVTSAMKEKSPEALITEHTGGEGIRFRGSSCKDMFYLIDKGTPVIALKDSSNAVMLIGYDALSVTYVDVSEGSIRSCSIEKMNDMTKGSGHTYIGYVK